MNLSFGYWILYNLSDNILIRLLVDEPMQEYKDEL